MPTALRQLQDTTREVLARVVGTDRPVAVLDFPSHKNAGDALIYLGQRAYLDDLGLTTTYQADIRNYDGSNLRAQLPSDGPVLLQGGGNLGDRWLHTQEFRERVVRELADHRIVQLPQTVEFADPGRAAAADGVFRAHHDLTLMLRDHEGVARARSLFPVTPVEFCPDLALGADGVVHQLAARLTPTAPTVDVVAIVRRDSESVTPDLDRLLAGVSQVTTDWGVGRRFSVRWVPSKAAVELRGRMASVTHRETGLSSSLHRMAELNVSNAIATLQQGRVVLADRLHAVVLAALLHKPVVALDNANHKIRRIFDDYLHDLPGVHYADGPAEAAELVAELARSAPRQGASMR